MKSSTLFCLLRAYPYLIVTLGLPTLAFIHAGICVVAIVFVKFVLPETKDLTLTEIDNLFELKSNKVSYISHESGDFQKTGIRFEP